MKFLVVLAAISMASLANAGAILGGAPLATSSVLSTRLIGNNAGLLASPLSSNIISSPVLSSGLIQSPVLSRSIVGPQIIGSPLESSTVWGSPILSRSIVGSPLVGSTLVGSPVLSRTISTHGLVGSPLIRSSGLIGAPGLIQGHGILGNQVVSSW